MQAPPANTSPELIAGAAAFAVLLLAWLAWLTWKVARCGRAVYWLRRDVHSIARQVGWDDSLEKTQALGGERAMTERIDPEVVRQLLARSKRGR
jgi:hypothetical protein